MPLGSERTTGSRREFSRTWMLSQHWWCLLYIVWTVHRQEHAEKLQNNMSHYTHIYTDKQIHTVDTTINVANALFQSSPLHRTHTSLCKKQCAACQSRLCWSWKCCSFFFSTSMLPFSKHWLFSWNVTVRGNRQQLAKHIIDKLSPFDGSSSTFPEPLANIIKLCNYRFFGQGF